MKLVCRRVVGIALLGLVLGPAWTPGLVAAPTAEQRAEIRALGTQMTKAGNLFKAGKFKETADVVKEAQARLDKLAEGADERMIDELLPVHKRLIQAHALLELEGVTLPELKPLAAKPAEGKPAPGKPGAPAGVPAGAVSFVKQVAPILNTRCGNCHVRNARGMFSMSTYEALMMGPPAGKVVFPANVDGSDLIVKVKDKEMPPNGAGIPDAELATLTKWVAEGAKFDGPDPKALLASLLPAGAAAPAMPMTTVQQATGKETVSFAKDIAPALVAAKCSGCHGMQQPRNNFNLTSIESLFRGGDSGEPILPGKPADSLLVKKLKGTGPGARMPLNGEPLSDETIAKFEKWIEEGAKFDGPDPKQPIFEVAAIAKAQGQTHEELSADRAALADTNWRLGMPGITATRVETANFLVMGDVGEGVLAEVVQKAEAIAPKVALIFKAPADQPMVKGKMSLFVFRERYDYGEFGKMVEKRDLPPVWRGHARYNIVDAYGAALLPRGDAGYSLDTLVAQELGAVYVASQGRGVPHWFSEGSGRVIADRLATADDARVAQWDNELPRIIGALAAPDDFLTGKLPPEDADICSFSFVKFLMADASRYQAVLIALRKGDDFTTAFSTAYGGSPSQITAAWVRKPPKPSKKAAKK